MNRSILLLSSLILLSGACTSPGPESKATVPSYFDLKGYIRGEAVRLQQLNPTVEKTVMVNGIPETKKMTIANWKKELSSFTDADINKQAWKGLFNVQRTGNEEHYRSDDDKVPVKLMTVSFQGKKVSSIRVINSNSNMLYTSADTLLYIPDSLYEMRKTQHIRLLKEKQYRILGKMKP